MASLNRVQLIGNLGKDPETSYTSGDSPLAIARISLCTNRKYKDAQGQMQEESEWHRVVAFGRVAEVAQTYLRKGSSAFIEGRLRSRKYTDKDGVQRYVTEVIAESLQLLDKKDPAQEAG